MIRRAGFVASLGAVLLSARSSRAQTPAAQVRAAWAPGWLEIHHISTGRGNSTLCIFPDGTSMLIDAGDAHSALEYMSPARPDASRRAGEWIGRYVERALRPTGSRSLDYFLLTHFHPDHMGQVTKDAPAAPDGGYLLTGISDVAQIVGVRTYIDRSYPAYDYLAPVADPSFQNYRRFIGAEQQRGARVEGFRVGSADQIHAHTKLSDFEVRNLAGSGIVWAGRGEETRAHFPPLETLKRDELPDENMCSLAIKISYGSFAYFAGGDLTYTTEYGAAPWRDIETPVAQVAGPVDVASVDHHGYYDGAGAGFLRALQPRVLVIPAWHATHPDLGTLDRLLDVKVYPGERDVFSTVLAPASLTVNERLVKQMRGTSGHVVIRVPPGGSEYTAAVVRDTDERDQVVRVFGPYPARGKAKLPLT